MKIVNTNNSKNEFNNNKISTNLNNNSKDLIEKTNLEKTFNNENKDEKIFRKSKFIPDNYFWDNNTGNLIEDNSYYSYFYQINIEDKLNELNRNIGKNIINNNININNLMDINKKKKIRNINNYQEKNENFSIKLINNIHTNYFNSRLLNSLEKDNTLNKSSKIKNIIMINSRNEKNNLKLINKKEYYSIDPYQNNNQRINKIKYNL